MVAIIVWCICSFICYSIAESKGRSGALWAALGILFGIFAVIVIALMPSQNE